MHRSQNHLDFFSARFFPFLLLLFAILLYLSALNGPFFFDDTVFILLNDNVRNFNISALYSSTVTSSAHITGGHFYRPTQQIVFAILYRIFGPCPLAFHLCSVFLHSLNAYLVFLFARKFRVENKYALLASLFFLAHPIQTQAVAYVSGLGDPLGLSFLLGALLCLIGEKDLSRNHWHYFFAFFFAILAMSCKENFVVIFPLMVITAVYSINKENGMWVLVSIVGVVSVGYAVARILLAPDSGLSSETNLYTENLSIRLISFLSIIVEYAQLVFYPLDLSYEKPYVAYASLLTLRGFIGTLLFLGPLIFLRGHSRFFLLWFWISLIPVSGIIPLNAIYLEHWLYTGMVGISIAMALLLNRIGSFQPRALLFVSLVLLGMLSIRTVLRNFEWGEPVLFYQNELRYTKNVPRTYHNLANRLMELEKFEEAVENYKQALNGDKQFPETYSNLAVAYLKLGRKTKAIRAACAGLKLQPEHHYSKELLKSLNASCN